MNSRNILLLSRSVKGVDLVIGSSPGISIFTFRFPSSLTVDGISKLKYALPAGISRMQSLVSPFISVSPIYIIYNLYI